MRLLLRRDCGSCGCGVVEETLRCDANRGSSPSFRSDSRGPATSTMYATLLLFLLMVILFFVIVNGSTATDGELEKKEIFKELNSPVLWSWSYRPSIQFFIRFVNPIGNTDDDFFFVPSKF